MLPGIYVVHCEFAHWEMHSSRPLRFISLMTEASSFSAQLFVILCLAEHHAIQALGFTLCLGTRLLRRCMVSHYATQNAGTRTTTRNNRLQQPKSHDPLSFRACQDDSLCHVEHHGTEVRYYLFRSDLSTYPRCIPSTYGVDCRSQLFITPFQLPIRQNRILKTYIRGTTTAKLRST